MLHETRVEEIEVRGFSTDQHRARGNVYAYVLVAAHLATLSQHDGGSFQEQTGMALVTILTSNERS